MKYYQVRVSAEPKIIGVKNGVHQLEIDENKIRKDKNYENFKKIFSHNNKEFWSNQEKIKDLNCPVINGKMLAKAKVTDIMGYAPEYSFLNDVYSQKYVDIIKAFKVEDSTFFEVSIDDMDKKFYFIFFKKILLSDIYYEKSIIYTGHKMLNNVRYFSIANFNEYNEFKITNPIHSFEKIAISKTHFDKDIISIQATGGNFYSEKLIDFLLDCGMTGLQVAYKNSIELEFV